MTPDRGLGRRLATAAVLLPLFVLTIVAGGWLFLVAVMVLVSAGIAERQRRCTSSLVSPRSSSVRTASGVSTTSRRADCSRSSGAPARKYT